MLRILYFFVCLVLIFPQASFAYRPFGTEDAGVYGLGVVQFEGSWDYLRWRDGSREKVYLFVPIYGLTAQLELSAEIPYLNHYGTWCPKLTAAGIQTARLAMIPGLFCLV